MLGTCVWYDVNTGLFTKYNKNANKGIVDNKVVVDLEDDAARVKWGDGWRLPSERDFLELINECEWRWVNKNGVNGVLITSSKTGYEDNYIFLPAAGYCFGSYRFIQDVDIHGYYMLDCSCIDFSDHFSLLMGFDDDGKGNIYKTNKINFGGISIRAVHD